MTTGDGELLDRLGAETGADGGGRVLVVDELVAQLFTDGAALDGPTAAALLRLLRDDTVDDDAGWSLLHAAETCPADGYAAALARVLPDLLVRAPVWADVVLGRALRDPDCHAALTRHRPDLPGPVRAAWDRLGPPPGAV